MVKEMEKFIFLLLMLTSLASVNAQVGKIEDNKNSVKITYPDGIIVGVMKIQVALVVTGNDGKVYLVTSHRWSNDNLTRLASIDPDDFGWSSEEDLRDYMDAMCAQNYDRFYSYEDSNMDTAFYYIGDSLAFYLPRIYTGSLNTYAGAPRHK